MAAADDRRMSTRATGVVGIAILSSRFLGLIREMIFAGLLGAGRNLDAFVMAFRLPNLLRDLFAEGALSTAFITTFSKKIAVEGDQSAWRLANKVATLTAVFMSAITLLGIVFAPQLVDLLTWGSWSPDKTELTILLTRIMWPFMLMVSLAALVMGMLNAKRVFQVRRPWRRVILISAQLSPVWRSVTGSIRISARVRSWVWRSARSSAARGS